MAKPGNSVHRRLASETAFDFYGTVIDALFEETRDIDPKKGSLLKTHYQARVYEFLGYSVTKGWLLFPFVHPQSGVREHLHLSHRTNQNAIFAKEYRPREADELLAELANMEVAKSTEVNRETHLRNLMLASDLRSLAQVTTPLLAKCVDLVMEANEPMTTQQAGKQRKTYNALIRLHNSRCAGAPAQLLLFQKRETVKLDDFSSFAALRAEHPHMSEWSQWFEDFVKETQDTQGQVRKTACSEFADFLCTLPNPPLSPLDVTRSLINDYSVGNTACYRGYLATKLSSLIARNGRLTMLSQFFDFVKDRLLARHRGDPKDAPWLAHPVDMKLDRFSETLKSGTTRKAIAAHVMEEMRKVLTEDEYAWPKSKGGWTHLVNEKTKALEYVWCPSAALLLYTLLTLPLRSLQARLFDSGEGDAFIFDFDRRAMVPNPNQVSVNGVIDPSRREGVLQVIPSGMLDVSDVIGEAFEMRDYLVTNSSYQGMYTGFDAMTDNAGLLQFRLGGICPGTRCEEGGITGNGRIAAVPVGDRGPSCPQCRFWLTGPAFLLGQCIEGNQLILKIRKKIQGLDKLRDSILEAEDEKNFAQADLLRGQADVEERQLNDMLTINKKVVLEATDVVAYRRSTGLTEAEWQQRYESEGVLSGKR